jgi:hypothetical protein
LLLNERLAQTNPLLIYKNIDAKITDEAQTVGIREALARLENLGLGIPDDEKKAIENIQKVRNRIRKLKSAGKAAVAWPATPLPSVLHIARSFWDA